MDGNEYQAVNQLRLVLALTLEAKQRRIRNPGQYRNGVELQNPSASRNGVFYIRVGTKNILLYPFLRGLGVSDQFIAQHIGEELTDINRRDHGHKVEQELRNFVKAYGLRPETEDISGYRKVIENEFFKRDAWTPTPYN